MFLRAKNAVRCAVAVAAVAGMALAGAAPAAAASVSGSLTCTYVSHISLPIDSSGPGSGSWQNRATGATSHFTFPGGASTKATNWLSVNWVVNNAGGSFYYKPSARCGS